MAKLKDRMRTVANKLINEYGDSCVLSKVVVTGKVYNPSTDEYEGTTSTTSINAKCVYRTLTLTEMQDDNSGAVKRVATIPYDDAYANIDTSWKIDSNTIIKIENKSMQDGNIVFVVYV